jgi:phenylacetate-coenzyme A ligase PaaK-like adenylate-forming protein
MEIDMSEDSLEAEVGLERAQNNLLKINPYSLSQKDKVTLLDDILLRLSRHHYENCDEYQKIVDALGFNLLFDHPHQNLPYLPVRLFKEYSLKSVVSENIFKTMTSSGTTGQQLSKIILDKQTAALQTKVLVKIVNSFMGQSRLPMIIVDSRDVLKNKNMFSARGAGILGFSMFGREKIFALDENMQPDENLLADFLTRHSGQRILIFGFTFIIWEHLFKYFLDKGSFPDLSGSVLVHGGGWKKLLKDSVSPLVYKESLKRNFGISEVHDYYGMIEQTGSIFMECGLGHLHASIFSDVIIRNHVDFSEMPIGEKGLIQLVSILPKSYPGHSLLTEDEGVLIGIDDCRCGRKGKYFKVTGRIQHSEIRGCSDTYAAEVV